MPSMPGCRSSPPADEMTNKRPTFGAWKQKTALPCSNADDEELKRCAAVKKIELAGVHMRFAKRYRFLVRLSKPPAAAFNTGLSLRQLSRL